MSQHDASALKVQAPITLAYRFRKFIDPQRLSQSLFLLLEEYPAFAGCLVCVENVLHVKTGAHDAEVQAIEVSPEEVGSSQFWLSISTQFPLRRTGAAGSRFYQVLLLHTVDPMDGCTALVTFDHGLADAFTCGHLMAAWSALHKALPAEPTTTDIPAPSPPSLPLSLPGDFEIECNDANLRVRRVHFRPEQLGHIKDAINARCNPQVTTNDILMAICVCTVARYVPRVGEYAVISMMVDARGRGLPMELLGNGARALDIQMPWDIALSRDLVGVAVELRTALHGALKDLHARCRNPELATVEVLSQDVAVDGVGIAGGDDNTAGAQAYDTPESASTALGVASDVKHGDDVLNVSVEPGPTPLFYFNSWAKLHSFVEADFGADLLHFEWVLLRTIQRRRSFIVVPVTADGGLAIQACLPTDEMDYFCQLWDTFTAASSA